MSPGELIEGDTQVVQIIEPCDIQLNSGDTPRRGVRLPNFVTCHKLGVKPGEETTGESGGGRKGETGTNYRGGNGHTDGGEDYYRSSEK